MRREKGQAIVLVLLSLAVVLTLVLYILSRSVTDILISSKTEEAARAFSAAEAGIEQALVIGTGGSVSNLGNNAGYDTTVSDLALDSPNFNYPIQMMSGDSITTWFVSHDDSGNTTCDDGKCFTGSQITVCWGAPGTLNSSQTAPAIEFSLFYETTPDDVSTVKIGRGVYDPNPARTSPNNFSGIDGNCTGIGGVNYAFQKTIDLTTLMGGTSPATEGVLRFARIRMLYNTDNPHLVGVSASGDVFPSQGINVVSTGTAGTSTRRVAVFQSWPEPPSIFDFAVYSSTGLVK